MILPDAQRHAARTRLLALAPQGASEGAAHQPCAVLTATANAGAMLAPVRAGLLAPRMPLLLLLHARCRRAGATMHLADAWRLLPTLAGLLQEELGPAQGGAQGGKGQNG